MKFHTKYNTGIRKCKRYFRSCRSVRRRTKQEAKNVRISAAGMEYRMPISPNAFGSSITSGTASRTSRKNDSPADSTGLPMACMKMNAALLTVASGSMQRYTRKVVTANSLYNSDSEPNRPMI